MENNVQIYDIENKKYLKAPEGYEFEHSLENNLYVFCKIDINKLTNIADVLTIGNSATVKIEQDESGHPPMIKKFTYNEKKDE